MMGISMSGKDKSAGARTNFLQAIGLHAWRIRFRTWQIHNLGSSFEMTTGFYKDDNCKKSSFAIINYLSAYQSTCCK
jgi:hypothetical protein